MKTLKSMSVSQVEYIMKINRQKRTVTFFRLLIFIFFLAAWEICADTEIINSFIFSSPSRIIKTFIEMASDGTLYEHVYVTLYETLICFFLVIFVGIGFAMLMWSSKYFSQILEPYIVLLNSLPKSALAPVLIVWLGNNIKTIIVAAVSVAVFGTMLSIYTGFMETDKEKIKLIYTLKGTRKDVLFKVVIPSSVPIIINTMKVNMGLSLVGVIIGEFLAANAGLGYLIIYGSQIFKMDWVMLSIVLLCILSVILYQLIHLLEKKVTK